ncbi:hypothetical protein [Rhodopseudomonas sp. RCAM05734]|uniref:hypothetical protein n=1 Tax=Rhodopseudomonas sp. RCAM05734 TaxID=3457549 RepID=UPI0040451258
MAGLDLGKWSWIAGMAVDFGLPVLGTALGIPGPVSAFAVNAIKNALNLPKSASADDVSTAIAADPDTARAALEAAQSDVAAKYAYLTRLAEVRGEVDKTNIAEVNETMRREMGRVSWWHWRHLLGYVIGFHILAFPVATFAVVIFSSPEKTNAILNFPLVGILGIGAGLLGFVANDTTRKGMAAMTGEAPEGVVASTVRAVTGRKK